MARVGTTTILLLSGIATILAVIIMQSLGVATVFADTVILNNDSRFTGINGTTATLAVDSKIYFCTPNTTTTCTDSDSTAHTITLRSLNLAGGTAVLDLDSQQPDIPMSIGQPQRITIPTDTHDILRISLVSITATAATITVKLSNSLQMNILAAGQTSLANPTHAHNTSIQAIQYVAGGVILTSLLPLAVSRRKRPLDRW